MKTFNTTGTCRPNEHYMVDITERLEIIRGMVAQGNYFCVNRGRQYGKTTTLAALADFLQNDYCVFSISFEGLDDSSFKSASTVSAEFLKILKRHARVNGSSEAMQSLLKEVVPLGCKEIASTDFTEVIDELCTLSEKPVIVMIDEVDQASNNDGFITFLGVLRNMFLSREMFRTFQSVILAGVYDIKNLKLKIRTEDEHQYNSPWNIAVPFDVDMSLSANGISGMLAEYKADHNLTFDEVFVGQMIRDYTAGYPFLVSRICQIIDGEHYTWDKEGVLKAVNSLLKESNTLFDDMQKKLTQFPGLSDMLKSIIFGGKRVPFNYYNHDINIAVMFNFVKEEGGATNIACRIFETWLYNYYISLDKPSHIYQLGEYEKNQFVHDGFLDVRLLIERFCVHFNEIYRPGHDDQFIEDNGRKIFLTYLRPIINGIGNYYCEAQTRDLTRTDIIIDYLGQQYIVELKIWRGQSYNERGEKQLAEYLERYNLQTGYMVSFCFSKTKKLGLLPPVELNGRTLIEAIV
ncbi:AAA family ATPase [Sodaliphilus sp.]|uniref:AAA family ATPase n=1 Tax=Sodaliphilus sp. TaxID=2815818 RepID=UPI0038911160